MELQTSIARRLRDPARRWLIHTPLERAARALYHMLVTNGVPVRIGSETVRFERGTEPPLKEPAHSLHVEYADYFMMHAFAQAIAPGSWVADVGAFAGTYTVVGAARCGPRGHLVAFEPSACNRARAMANLARNAYDRRATVRAEAVSDRAGEAEFYVEAEGDSTQNSFFRELLPDATRAASTVRAERVRTVDLDSCFAALGRLPDVVKIDAEGAELAVLRGASAILASGAAVICELHPLAWHAAGHSGEDLRSWIEERGRVLVDLRTGERVEGELTYGPYRLVPSA